MMTREEVQEQVCARADELATQEHFQGPGKFAMKHYTLALAERSPAEREAERGMLPDGEGGSQQARASRHLAKEITRHEHKGYSRAEAIRQATTEERESGLHETRAALPKDSPWAAQGQRDQREQLAHFAKVSGQQPGAVVLKTHAAGTGPATPWHDLLRRLGEADVVSLVAASKLSRADAAEWAMTQKGRKPINLPLAASRVWDQAIEATVEVIMRAAELQRLREQGRDMQPVR